MTLLVIVGLAVVGWLVWVYVTHTSQGNKNALNSELLRIEQAKQAAMEDIRRRRQYAEEQLRRLGRWSK